MKKILKDLKRIEKETEKIYNHLNSKIENKTLSDKDVENYKNKYITYLIKQEFILKFCVVEIFFDTIEKIQKFKNDIQKEWKNLSLENLIAVNDDKVYSYFYQLYPLKALLKDNKMEYLIKKFGGKHSYRVFYEDYLKGEISLKELLNFVENY